MEETHSGEQEDLLPDTDVRETGTKRKSTAGKIILISAAALYFLAFAILSLNSIFGISDSLPAWEDLYYAAGLRVTAYTGHESGTVSVHFINVGQGDCALIRTGEKNILIDSGEWEEYTKVSRYLSAQGITARDSGIISHQHSDHMGCMYRIVQRFGASEIIMPEVPEYLLPSSGSFVKLEELVKEMNIPVRTAAPGITADTDGCGELTFIAPVKEYDDLNNFSAVVKYTFGDVSFLFCGDIESEAEADIIASGTDLSAAVIKAPHHGSLSSSTKAFINAVSPEYTVFCAGNESEYGHPNADVVQRCTAIGSEIYRTAADGDIVFVTDGSNIEVYTTKQRSDAA